MIDIHTHFFNLKYLPVAGIIRRYTHNRVPHIIAKGVEIILIHGTEQSLLPEIESNIQTESKPVLTQLNKRKPASENGLSIPVTVEETINRMLNRVIPEALNDQEVLDALETYQAIENETENGFEFIDFQKKWESVSDADTLLRINMIGRMIRWVITKMKDGVNYFKWFAFMQNSETNMVEYLSKVDEPPVQLFVHQLMDVDNFFNNKYQRNRYSSTFPTEIQIRRMEALNKKYGAKLKGMVAFDPSKADAVDIVKDAIKNKGIAGVKFYPPMGYTATDDISFSQKIKELFDYCIADDVPLFSHCNNGGFEAFPKKNSGHCSNPMYWKALLENPVYSNLRLCLAHAGGNEGWFAPIDPADETDPEKIKDLIPGQDDNQKNWNASYAKIVYYLCCKFPNVYCDAVYLDEATEQSSSEVFKKRLQILFNASPHFSKKLIYGSDWHMLFQEGKNNFYLKAYTDLYSTEKGFTKEQVLEFFEQNAKTYLGLS